MARRVNVVVARAALLQAEEDGQVDPQAIGVAEPVAVLVGADLRGVDLSLADLTGADLRGADLRGADLSRALFVTPSQLESVRRDASTRAPAR